MFLSGPRVSRALSAFDYARHRWAAIPFRDPTRPRSANAHDVGRQTLSLTSWNINASQSGQVERSRLILDHILEGPKRPDVIHLQEVASSVRQSLLSDARVRSSFLATDAEDDTAFKGVQFATMTLLSNERFATPVLAEKKDGSGGEGEGEGEGGSKLVLDSVFRMELASRYRRDALGVDICHPAVPGAFLRLFNVHLDSLDSQFRRWIQIHVLDGLLREPGCGGGVIAGDFNAIHPDDYTLVDEHGLVDAWVALHGSTAPPGGGATWGVGASLADGLKPGRLDKVVMLGLQPIAIEVLTPGLVNAHTPWSDHCGLHCTFAV